MAKSGSRQGRPPARRRNDPKDVSDAVIRLLDLVDIVTGVRAECANVASAARQSVEAATTAVTVVRQVGERVGHLAARGHDVGDVAAFVGGVAAVTDLLSLNTGIDDETRRQQERDRGVRQDDELLGLPDSDTGSPGQRVDRDSGADGLTWEAVQAAQTIAVRIGAMGEEVDQAVLDLATCVSAMAEVEERQGEIIDAAARQAALADDLATRIDATYQMLTDLLGERAGDLNGNLTGERDGVAVPVSAVGPARRR